MGLVRGQKGSNMKKCKHCPMKKHCKDECYGENPCAFAIAFDNLARRIDLKTVCIESLRAELKEKKDNMVNIDDVLACLDGLDIERPAEGFDSGYNNGISAAYNKIVEVFVEKEERKE